MAGQFHLGNGLNRAHSDRANSGGSDATLAQSLTDRDIMATHQGIQRVNIHGNMPIRFFDREGDAVTVSCNPSVTVSPTKDNSLTLVGDVPTAITIFGPANLQINVNGKAFEKPAKAVSLNGSY